MDGYHLKPPLFRNLQPKHRSEPTTPSRTEYYFSWKVVIETTLSQRDAIWFFFFLFNPTVVRRPPKCRTSKTTWKRPLKYVPGPFLSFLLASLSDSALPLTFAPSFSDHRGRHEQPGAPCGAGQPREPVQSGLHSERDERAGLWFPSRKPSLHPLPTPPGAPLPLLCHKTQFFDTVRK